MGILDKFKKSSEEVTVAKSVVVDAPAKEAVKPKTDKAVGKISGDKRPITGILIRPSITEKASNLASLNQYVFDVVLSANKIQIAHAVESKYGIKPIGVNIIKNAGKYVRYGRSFGKQKDTKKAIVFLPAGKSIRIHEGA